MPSSEVAAAHTGGNAAIASMVASLPCDVVPLAKDSASFQIVAQRVSEDNANADAGVRPLSRQLWTPPPSSFLHPAPYISLCELQGKAILVHVPIGC